MPIIGTEIAIAMKVRVMSSEHQDIVGAAPVGDFVVIGWFTPNYRPLAEKFAANLAEHDIPHHLWAKPSSGTWNTMRKPAIVLEAMDAYPGKTVVLMDVDCVVRGDITPVIQTAADLAVTVMARNIRRGGKWRHRVAAECSSRVIVFRPTSGARAFAVRWVEQIERNAFPHDEHAMMWTLLASIPTTTFSYIDPRYSGRNIGQVQDAVIEHDSAHEEQRRASRGPVNLALRAIERRLFRTGRTKKSRIEGELAVLLKAK
jgi:GNAT superfamily N-acetyltransferase